jgi:putative hydrolases of HD superfamily
MNTQAQLFTFILEMNRLKTVFRNSTTLPDRKESTAEHSWSVGMITMVLMNELKQEFPDIDELKAIKLSLTHDMVEIYAGDVMAFDIQARKDKEADESKAMEKLQAIYPEFGTQLSQLWHEFEKKESLEAKIAKASDAICPIFLRLQSGQFCWRKR